MAETRQLLPLDSRFLRYALPPPPAALRRRLTVELFRHSPAQTTSGTTIRRTVASESLPRSCSIKSRRPAELVNTLAIPSNMVNTSFSSKSELGINLSTDGTVLTFMAYIAPPNTIDVSNSNTPGVYDPTNPAGGSYFRGVVQVGANGAIQVTPTNAYCGNNGRAAILANGVYYLVGNSNNGSGTPANVVAAGGAQIATPGQSGATVPTQIGNFSIAQITNPATRHAVCGGQDSARIITFAA